MQSSWQHCHTSLSTGKSSSFFRLYFSFRSGVQFCFCWSLLGLDGLGINQNQNDLSVLSIAEGKQKRMWNVEETAMRSGRFPVDFLRCFSVLLLFVECGESRLILECEKFFTWFTFLLFVLKVYSLWEQQCNVCSLSQIFVLECGFWFLKHKAHKDLLGSVSFAQKNPLSQTGTPPERSFRVQEYSGPRNSNWRISRPRAILQNTFPVSNTKKGRKKKKEKK